MSDINPKGIAAIVGATLGLVARTGRTTPNTTDTKPGTTLRIIDLISEGPIEGLVGTTDDEKSKSIILENTPLIGADGEANFQGVVWEQRFGENSQASMTEASDPNTEITIPVGVELKGTIATTRRISGEGIDAMRIILLFQSLYEQKKNGDLTSLGVNIQVEIKLANPPRLLEELTPDQRKPFEWQLYGTLNEVDKKTNPFEVSLRIDFAEIREITEMGDNPYANSDIDIRITRTTADFTDILKNGTVSWSSYVSLIMPKIAYSDSAVIGLHIDGDLFASQATNRAYDIHGIQVEIPSNYSVPARSYTGMWDGCFKEQLHWTNNPAWILYALLTNTRYGLGETIQRELINKWSFYEAAKYNDEMVSNGEGGKEPRFTFNGVLDTRKEAYTLLNEVAASFRARLIFSGDRIELAQDRAKNELQQIVSNANVVEGIFTYTGSAYSARHSVCAVSWINPKQGWQPSRELVVRGDAVKKVGWNQLDITGYGITSRAQARRAALWALLTEERQTQIVKYSAGLDHMALRVGDLIAISDSAIQGGIIHGKVSGLITAAARGGATSSATGGNTGKIYWNVKVEQDVFNAEVLEHIELVGGGRGDGLKLFIFLPEGLYELTYVSRGGGDTNITPRFYFTNDDAARLFERKFAPTGFGLGVLYTFAEGGGNPETYKVLSIVESGVGIFEIEALQHNEAKFDEVDSLASKFETELVESQVATLENYSSSIAMPEFIYQVEGTAFAGAELSWETQLALVVDGKPRPLSQAQSESEIAFYRVSLKRPDENDFTEITTTSSTTLTLRDIVPGKYEVQIEPISILLVPFKKSLRFEYKGDEGSNREAANFELGGLDNPPGDVANFDITNENGITILTWDVVDVLDLSHYEIRFTQSPSVLWERAPFLKGARRVIGTSYTTPSKVGRYLIKAIDTGGNESVNASFILSNISGLADLNLAVGYVRPGEVIDDTLTERAITLSGVQLPSTFKRGFGVQETRLMRTDSLFPNSTWKSSSSSNNDPRDTTRNWYYNSLYNSLPSAIYNRPDISSFEAQLRYADSITNFNSESFYYYPRRIGDNYPREVSGIGGSPGLSGNQILHQGLFQGGGKEETFLQIANSKRTTFNGDVSNSNNDGQNDRADAWEGTNGSITEGVLTSEPHGVLSAWTSLAFDDSILVHRDCVSFTTTGTGLFLPGEDRGGVNNIIFDNFAPRFHIPLIQPDLSTISSSESTASSVIYNGFLSDHARAVGNNLLTNKDTRTIIAMREEIEPNAEGVRDAHYPALNPRRPFQDGDFDSPTLPTPIYGDYGFNANLVYQFPMIDFGAPTDFVLSIDAEWETILADDTSDWRKHIPDVLQPVSRIDDNTHPVFFPVGSDIPNDIFVAGENFAVGGEEIGKIITDISRTELLLHIAAIDTSTATIGEFERYTTTTSSTRIRAFNRLSPNRQAEYNKLRADILTEYNLNRTLKDGSTAYVKQWGTDENAEIAQRPGIKLITTEGDHRATCIFPTLIWRSPAVIFSRQSTLMMVKVKKLILRFDVKDRIESGKDILYNPSEHTETDGWMTINFEHAFVNEPAIVVDVADLEFRREKHIRNKTASSFEIRFIDGRTADRVSKTFDFLAKGFGLISEATLVDNTTGNIVE